MSYKISVLSGNILFGWKQVGIEPNFGKIGQSKRRHGCVIPRGSYGPKWGITCKYFY